VKVAVYTSFTFSYLAKARVLAESLKKHHPDWHFIALITDIPPEELEFDIEKEQFDEVVWSKDLPVENFEEWIGAHNIVEACTAVKGPALNLFASSGRFDVVMYLDPDVAVFASLKPIIDLLEHDQVILTPHQLSPEKHDDHIAIIDNELSSTKHGVYNLGFVCVKCEGSGLKFAEWWAERLKKYCRDDIPNGMFTDQKWCDLVPAYFDNVKILRDPGYNVASWNISQRTIKTTKEGDITVNGYLLRFYHFTKLGPIGRKMSERYAGDNYEVYELWKWYERRIEYFDPKIDFGWEYEGLVRK
jgi:hypothetical protein